MEKKFNKFKIFQAGCGGTGGHLIPILSKFINNIKDKKGIDIAYSIYDADIVEEKNLIRQNFFKDDVGEYKAEVLGERYSVDDYNTIFLTTDTIDFDAIEPSDGVNIIIGCTDSVKFRLDVIKFLKSKSPEEMLWVYVDGGNLDKGGQVLVNHNLSTDQIYSNDMQDFEKLFNERLAMRNEETKRESCSDLGDQTIGMNFTSALYIYNIVTEFLGTSQINCNFISFRRYNASFNVDKIKALINLSY